MFHNLFRSIQMIYYGLLGGQILFCLVTLFLIYQKSGAMDRLQFDYYGKIAAFLMITTINGAVIINRLRKKQAAQLENGLAVKLTHYRTSVILRSAMLEAGNLFALTVAVISLNVLPVAFFLVGLLCFFFLRPSRDEFSKDYELNLEEQQEFSSLPN